MDKTKLSQIEDFARVGSNTRLLGFDKEGNKVGFVPYAALTSKTEWCGCRWRKSDSSSEGEPIGNLDMLAELKGVLGLGGYLVQNDHTRQKLASDNHFKLANGGTAKLDGTMGHYMWGTGCNLYYATWEDDEYEYEAVATSLMPGRWNYKVPIFSIAASGASALDRTNNILVSYCNRTAQYRGGNNNADVDTAWNTQLGKPVVNVAENSLQRYAEKNGARWGASMYMVVFIVGALMRIVFHNRNIQKSYNAAKTADGLFQGGLGMGVDDVNGSFNNQYATLDIDALADKGDAMGVFSYDCKDGNTVKLTIKNIPSFFGLKNFYHYIYTMLHGCNIVYTENEIEVWAIRKWSSKIVATDDTNGMEKIGSIPNDQVDGEHWIKRENLANMLLYPLEFGGSETTYYGDAMYYTKLSSGLRGLFALGHAGDGGMAGVGRLTGQTGPSGAWASRGAALCEAAEDWNTVPFWVD